MSYDPALHYAREKKPAKRPPASRLPAPVDHEVRPMPKPAMSSKEREIRDECRALSEMDWDAIADRLVTLLEADRHGSTIPDGRPTRTLNTDIPAADPEALTSTEAAVNAVVFAGTGSKRTGDATGKLERDPVREAFLRARAALGQMTLALDPLMDNLNAGKAARVWSKPIGQTSTPCKADGCDGPAVARGWCDPCRKWIARNPTVDGVDPVTVPAHVIEERTKRRAKAS